MLLQICWCNQNYNFEAKDSPLVIRSDFFKLFIPAETCFKVNDLSVGKVTRALVIIDKEDEPRSMFRLKLKS